MNMADIISSYIKLLSLKTCLHDDDLSAVSQSQVPVDC